MAQSLSVASLSTVIQGLLVTQLPDYEISNDAIGYLCNFSEKLLLHLVNETQQHGVVSGAEVKIAICSTFPSEWSESILNNAISQLITPRYEERDSLLKQEINDFELIDDGDVVAEERRPTATRNLFISTDFIKSFLPQAIASQLGSDGCVYLSASIESVISKFIQEARATLQRQDTDRSSSRDPMVITQQALEEALRADQLLGHIGKLLRLYTPKEPEGAPDFEPIVDDALEQDASDTEIQEIEHSPEIAPEEQNISDVPLQAAEEPVSHPENIEEERTEPSVVPEATAPPLADLPPVATTVSDLDEQAADGMELLLHANSQSIAMVREPMVGLYGQCCPYFDISTLAIHMLSSIVELFIRHVISETNRLIHRPHTRVLREHVREAVRRLTTFQSQMLENGQNPSYSLFNECVKTCVKANPTTLEWSTDSESYIAEVVVYVGSRILLLASAHARLAGLWIINSSHITSATCHVISDSVPIAKLIQLVHREHPLEGPVLEIIPAPRIRAAEMIYLSSIIKETPLQLDNQLLVIFVFLVTLSIHTLCVR